MRYIASLTNFSGVRCWPLVGLAGVNELLKVTITLGNPNRRGFTSLGEAFIVGEFLLEGINIEDVLKVPLIILITIVT